MNRSLEALAILVICLVGILAAVRMSTKDRSSPVRAAAQMPDAAPKGESPEGSSSSASASTKVELTYDDSCGLDLATGHVYRPLKPLLSPSAFAAGVIRSEPLPLIVLPEAEAVEVSTGYDAAYDGAMTDSVAQVEAIDYQQVEVGYAAAELDAATIVEKTSQPFAAWMAMSARWEALRRGTVSQVAHYERAYSPVFRGLNIHWREHVRPRMSHFPRTHREQVSGSGAISWPQYLAFAERNLPAPEFEAPDATWVLISSTWGTLSRETTSQVAQYQRAYSPVVRGLFTRWNERVRPQLLQLPGVPPTAKKNLLHYQRAEATTPGAISWRDYLSFAEKHLPVQQDVQSQTDDRRVTRELMGQASNALVRALKHGERLFSGAGQQVQRVARQYEEDDLWRAR